MKSNEIVVGTEYAIARWGTVDKYNLGNERLERVTVLNNPKAGIVHVCFNSDGLAGRIEQLPVRKIVTTWLEYADAFNRQLAWKAMAKERTLAAADRIPTWLPEGTPIPHWAHGEVYTDGSYSSQGAVSVAELENLLAQAFAAGKASA
jgi:hypothetical protein